MCVGRWGVRGLRKLPEERGGISRTVVRGSGGVRSDDNEASKKKRGGGVGNQVL